MNEIISKLIRQAIYALAGASAAGVGPFTDTNIDQVAGSVALLINFAWSWFEYISRKKVQSDKVITTGIKLSTIALSSVLLIGCTTTQTGEKQIDTDRVARIAGRAAYLGTTGALIYKPESRPAFEKALDALTVLEATDNSDASALAQALSHLDAKELKGDQGRLIIAAIGVFVDELGARTPLQKPELVKKSIPQIAGGIRRALDDSQVR